MIAYCGLKCDTCPILLATLEQDKSRQLIMRQSIARECSKLYGMNIDDQDVNDCDGCLSNSGRLFYSCINCEIRKCATERVIESCAFCNEYSCDKLMNIFSQEPDAKIRLDEIRKIKRN